MNWDGVHIIIIWWDLYELDNKWHIPSGVINPIKMEGFMGKPEENPQEDWKFLDGWKCLLLGTSSNDVEDFQAMFGDISG